MTDQVSSVVDAYGSDLSVPEALGLPTTCLHRDPQRCDPPSRIALLLALMGELLTHEVVHGHLPTALPLAGFGHRDLRVRSLAFPARPV